MLCCLAPPAWGAHPLITEDTGTQGTGRWQIDRALMAGITLRW